jgi:hypothetical protein
MRPTRPHVNGPRCGLSKATRALALAPGGVVCGGIHMSAIPSISYRDLWGERSIRPVANLTREDALADLGAGRFSGAAVLVPLATSSGSRS